jgi:hypothetical protein
MPRRLAPLVALLAVLAIGACNAAPATPALTDPKDILAKTVLSLKDVKTVDAKGELTGSFSASGTSIDLKGTTFEIQADVPGKKVKASASVSALLNTSAEAIFVDQALYYKILGPLAAQFGADPTGKYKKIDAPMASPGASGDVTDPQKASDDLRAQLDKLPSPPTKGANEKIGDQDCYHVTLKVTSDELKTMNPAAGSFAIPGIGSVTGELTVDVWSRTNDLRPAKVAVAVNTGTMGTFTLTFNLSYDSSLSIAAPAADQIAP